MDQKQFRRNAAKLKAAVVETPDGRLIAKESVTIYVPRRFESAKLVNVGEIISIAGIFAIVTADFSYAMSSALATLRITPTSTTIVDFNGDDYYGFYFESGSTITESVNLIKDDKLPYKVFDEVYSKGNVPWFMGMQDLVDLFKTTVHHAGLSLTGSNTPFEIITAAICRDSKDIRKYRRETIQSMADELTNPAQYIALRNVIHGTTNTISKLMGSHFDDALMSALVNPSEEIQGVEALLRA